KRFGDVSRGAFEITRAHHAVNVGRRGDVAHHRTVTGAPRAAWLRAQPYDRAGARFDGFERIGAIIGVVGASVAEDDHRGFSIDRPKLIARERTERTA